MKVVFIGSFLYPHGFAATKRKQQFLEYLVNKGDNCIVIVTTKLSKGSELNPNKGVYNNIPYIVTGKNVKANLLFPIYYILMTIKTCYLIYRYYSFKSKNVLVIFGLSYDTILPAFFAKMLSFKIVFDIVEDFSTIKYDNAIKGFIFYFQSIFPKKFIPFLANSISVISKRLLEKYSKIRRNNINVKLVPVSASNLDLRFTRNKNTIFTLLYAGTYGEKEGLETLFDAYKCFVNDIPKSRLVLTGNCPAPIKSYLKASFHSLDNFVFTGKMAEEKYYETLINADLLLMTRTNSSFANHGFPYKLGEYLATGNPVVCTDVSDVRVYLKNFYSAIIVPPDDVKSLYNAMKFIYQNPNISHEIGNNGKNVASRMFNPVINSEIFYSLL